MLELKLDFLWLKNGQRTDTYLISNRIKFNQNILPVKSEVRLLLVLGTKLQIKFAVNDMNLL
jgi:hypothetical protein